MAFESKVAIVTGGGSGIGKETSKELASLGVKVVVADIDFEAAQSAVQDIRALGGEATAVHGNTAIADDSRKAVDFALETYGTLNYAVNNAGIGSSTASTGEMDLDDWDRVVGVNLNGVAYGMRYQIPAIVAAGAGAIVNLSSVHGVVANPGKAGYVATKHAVVGLTKNAAAEYGLAGLRVNAVGPGYIDTPLLAAATPSVRKHLADKHPLGRFGTAKEVAKLIRFLLSDDASFITGGHYIVDGGYTVL